MEELERITEWKGLKESTRATWKEFAPKIISQARLESHSRNVDLAYMYFLSSSQTRDHALCGSSLLG